MRFSKISLLRWCQTLELHQALMVWHDLFLFFLHISMGVRRGVRTWKFQ